MERAVSEYVEDNAPNRWISVDERLPEVGDHVLTSDGYYIHLCVFIEEAEHDEEYRKNYDPDWCGHWLNLDSAVHYAQNVIVWMPLPLYNNEENTAN